MPHHLIAAAAAHPWPKEWTGAATGLASIAFFWLGMVNVTLLAIVFSVATKRRDLRSQAHRWRSTLTDPPHGATDHPARRATDQQTTTRDARAHVTAPGELEPAAARMLLSDTERDEAVDNVCAAMAHGRLGIDEGVERIDKVLAARRRSTLAPILADLPHEVPQARAFAPSAGVLALRVAAAALIAGAAVLQGLTGIWALWPVAIAALAPMAFSPRQGRAPARETPALGHRGNGA